MSRSGGSLHALRYLPNIRYGISLFIFLIRYSYAVFRYSYSLFVIHIRNSYALFEVFFRITHFCAVTNNKSNPIRNRKNRSKRLKSLR